jgi:hypothetical protein
LANIPDSPARFLETFRRDGWIDGWLIHDWLDYNSEILISRHSSHNRAFLVETYKKHNRLYGKRADDPPHPDGTQGKLPGSDWEVVGKGMGSLGDRLDLPVTLSPSVSPNGNERVTLSPSAHEKGEIRSPKGGGGGNSRSPPAGERASCSNFQEGSRAQGFPILQSELSGDGLTLKEVFEAFYPLLAFHGIHTMEAFYARLKRCRASPAGWMMLYLDKIHAVYRSRKGGPLLEGDADPVGMTMAGLTPGKNRCRHQHTEAARSLFIEIMIDHHKSQKGEKSKWRGKLSGPSMVLELERRKGKAGKIA